MNRREAVALGEAPADLVVRGGRVFRPEARTFDDVAVAIVDGTVAALPADADSVTGAETTVVEATDRVVVPGFVDAHTHLDLHQSFDAAYHYALRGGTTSFVTEASGIGTAFGADGVEAFLDALADLPVTVRVAVPPQSLFDTFGPAEEARGDALEALLDDPRVVGVGESAWVHVVGRGPPAERLYERARELGKTVTGHGAGCSGATLQAFAGAVTDDHEAITSEGVEARVEHGIHAVGRCGSIRDDLDAFAEAYEMLGASELSLCTDGVWPRDLLDGCMDAVVERAIDAGIAPVDALRMATLNPARHFGLDAKGTLAPGSDADVVILEDLETVDVASVVADGDVVVHNHDLRVGPRAHDYPDEFYDAVRTPSADAWRVPVDATDGTRVEAIAYDEGLLSTPTTVEPTRASGELRADPANDIAKVGLFDRRDGESGFVGFCTGFGIEGGALATTATWETPGVLGLGVDDADLRQAVAHVGDVGGGWAVVRDGEVLVDLPYSIGGVASARDVEETAQLLSAVEEATRRLGIDAARPLLGVQTLTFTGVPARKLTFGGYAEIRERAVVGLAPQ